MRYIFSLLLLSCTTLASAQTVTGLYFANSSLRLASADVTTGEVEILSQQTLSPDGFASGVADFDPFEKRYYYMRGSRLYVVDGITGELLANHLLDAVVDNVSPLTNIAYNWLDGYLYGVLHQYVPMGMSGQTRLSLAKVNPETGEYTLLSDTPTSYSPFLSGNSDIDVINREYVYATTDRIFRVDLDTGALLSSAVIQTPELGSGQDFLVNLAYDWTDDQWYGLYFYSNGGTANCSGSLRLATFDEEGVVTVISDQVLSPDCFSMGDCDIDAQNNVYYYIRSNGIYSVDLESGDLIDAVGIDNPLNATAPMINMTFDDLYTLPDAPVAMNMGDGIALEDDTPLTLSAWVGDEEVSYLWSTGETTAAIDVSTPGEYSVVISRGAFSAEGSIEVTIASSLDELDLALTLFPNPTEGAFRLQGETEALRYIELYDATGRIVYRSDRPSAVSHDPQVASGLYQLLLSDGQRSTMRRLLID